MRREERLDRQLRIEGWDQAALATARIGVVGDADLLASLYIVSAAALGINQVVVLAPTLDDVLVETATKVNPAFDLVFLEGFYTHPALDDLWKGCGVLVDVSRYGLANKLLLEKGFREQIPILRGFCFEDEGEQGLRIFTYLRGREWQGLESLISPNQLPADHFDDGVLDIIAAGILLEETANVLMGRKVSAEVITYRRSSLPPLPNDARVCVVGAGTLGNFVGLGLAYAGLSTISFIDHDIVDVTNLNRQILLYDAVGLSKAETLAQRLKHMFGIDARADVRYVGGGTDISGHDVIFDCVDNFETKIDLSNTCRREKKLLVSGGSGIDAGQVVVYDPVAGGETPAELLGLSDIVAGREANGREGEGACAYQPDPSIIMTNQITAGFMVDSYRMVLSGRQPAHIFYDSTSDKRI